MAYSIVQHKRTSTASVSSLALSFDATPTVGNFIIVGATGWKSLSVPGTFSASDNQSGNSYHEDVSLVVGGTNQRYSSSLLSSKVAAASGTFTVTITPANTPADLEIYLVEIALLDPTTWLDQVCSNSGVAGTTIDSGTTAATNAAGGIFLFLGGRAGLVAGGITPSGTLTQLDEEDVNTAPLPSNLSYKSYSGGSAQNDTMSITAGNDNWLAVGAAYVQASGGGGGGVTVKTLAAMGVG